MARDLYQLEGQQLRMLKQRSVAARQYLIVRQLGTASQLLEELERTIEQILADGPHARDEQD
jgi:hypothetical protein